MHFRFLRWRSRTGTEGRSSGGCHITLLLAEGVGFRVRPSPAVRPTPTLWLKHDVSVGYERTLF
jgi:hypothetical protein